MAVKGLRNLCTPSYIYLVVSVIALVVMMYQNMGNVDKYCLGSYTCNVSSTALIFVIKAIYILFWTWVLNLICNAGAPGVAWFVLLLPIILLFVLLAGMMFYENTKEGLKEGVVNGGGGKPGPQPGSGSAPPPCPADPPCGHITTKSTCIKTSTPSGHCYWNDGSSINKQFAGYCATYSGGPRPPCTP